jgi:POT family proton-dependent oligopeptide transporter
MVRAKVRPNEDEPIPLRSRPLKDAAMRIDAVLFCSATELWERFTYYAMRTLLVLYLVGSTAGGGFELPDLDATAIYGVFVAAVYLAALPGGWIGDQYLGRVRTVWLGGLSILAGNLILALVHDLTIMRVGLGFIAVGVGLLKPNVTSLVAQIAKESARSIDGAFTIFYIGINVGGLLGPLVSAALAAHFGWRYGFAAAAVGMVIGLCAFARVSRQFSQPIVRPTTRALGVGIAGAIGAIVLVATLAPAVLARLVFGLVLLAAAAAFVSLTRAARTPDKRRNVRMLCVLFCGATLFWAAEEQAGASLTLFAERFTRRSILGYSFPSAWYQALPSLYVILIAPVFVWIWQRLATRGVEPTVRSKFGIALVSAAVGLAVAAIAVLNAPIQGASPGWLAVTYLLISLGEVIMAPVGFSSATTLAPARRTGFAAGTWYLSLSLGGLIAGLSGGAFNLHTHKGLAATFGSVALVLALAGAAFLIVARYRDFRHFVGASH